MITIKNNITGLINHIEFKLFKNFNNQSDYMAYLIESTNKNMDSILHIRSRTLDYFTKEHLKIYLSQQESHSKEVNVNMVQKMAELEYSEMISDICVNAVYLHYKKTLKIDFERRKKLADEYEKMFLGILNDKKN